MKNHPEQLPGEVFIGNSKPGEFKKRDYLSGLSFREGKQAYDIHGTTDGMDGCVPLFLSEIDAARYDRIMTDRTTHRC